MKISESQLRQLIREELLCEAVTLVEGKYDFPGDSGYEAPKSKPRDRLPVPTDDVSSGSDLEELSGWLGEKKDVVHATVTSWLIEKSEELADEIDPPGPNVLWAAIFRNTADAMADCMIAGTLAWFD